MPVRAGSDLRRRILLFIDTNDFLSNGIGQYPFGSCKPRRLKLGVSISTVMRRFDRLAVKEMTEVQELPRVIAIYEYRGDTKEGKYHLIMWKGSLWI